MKIIGRNDEQKELKSCLKSFKPEFVVIYGRRRIGKTFLIRNFFDQRFSFYTSGVNNKSNSVQLKNFNNALNEYGFENKEPIKDWFEAFSLLKELLEKKDVYREPVYNKRIVFLDELPWMDAKRSDFKSALDLFWNTYASTKDDLILIVCGSATSRIMKNMVKDEGGFYNRITRKIHLLPFSLNECLLYSKYLNLNYNEKQVIDCYMVFGGVPYYWELINNELSLAQNIDNLCFKENGQLHEEYQALFKSLFSAKGKHRDIIEALMKKNAGMAFAGADRVFALIDEKPEEDDGYVTLVNAKYNENGELCECKEKTNLWAWKHPHHDGTTTLTELKGNIVLDHVDFGYEENHIVLHDISINAAAGQKMAFVGATGAGKTTITNLINRFYDIADGKIRYDGININKIKKADLRNSLTVVLQETNLFTGTVADNIRYGKLDASDEKIVAAAKTANAYDFIMKLPDGFNTMLTSDGANLSQGQRQLLSIARAAIADTPLLILDEATSSIDTRTEKLVQKGTDEIMKDRTVFVIAHRLSTVQNADRILVLDHGRIIEQGNHEELIAKHGTYYQLYTGAFELE